MSKYVVKSPLKYKGKRHEPGKQIEIDDDVAEQLVANGTVETPASKAAPKADDKK